MTEVVSEIMLSIDGAARGEKSPANYGYTGPDFMEWLAQKSAQAHRTLIGRKTLDALSGVPEAFLDDGRVEIASNVVERAIKPIALNRKNAHFAGSDGGAEHWAVIASLVETAKLNGVDPQSYLADIIARIVAGHPQSQLDDLLPWAYAATQLRAVA